MKIRIVNSVAGAGFAFAAGDELEVIDAVALELMRAGHAVPVKPAAEIETTRAPQPVLERATNETRKRP